MVTVGMYYEVIPGQGATFQAKFAAVAQALKAANGHQSSYLYQRVDEPDSYAILSEWNDADAFHQFIKSDAFREVTAWGRANVLRGRPRHEIYPRSEEVGPTS
jgi:heme-degrading monooxygenase HmoA